jgi:hypothetical protein
MDVRQFHRLLPWLQCLLVCLPPVWLCGCTCGRVWYIQQAKRWMKRQMDLDLDVADLTYSIQVRCSPKCACDRCYQLLQERACPMHPPLLPGMINLAARAK